jgi:CO/xanthine dehydrogenase FAD-binding subunit
MKAASFDYVRPPDLAAACAILAADEGARIIAGGQTLVPLMAMRLARPTRLVDIARIPDLAFVRQDGDCLVIGATTRQCVAEAHPLIAARLPLLAKALPWVGHAATRARGTIGGSLANADPAAEIPLIAVTLDATLTCRDAAGSSEIPAGEFFIAPMVTGLPTGACLVAVRFPVWPETQVGVGFHEVSARRSDFAFAAAAAQVALDADGVCRRIALGIGAVTDVPVRLDHAEQALVGTRLDPAMVRGAVHGAMSDIEAASDTHASADYRRRAAATLAQRAIADARAMAGEARRT